MTAPSPPTYKPTVPGSIIAVVAGIVAVALVIDTSAQWQALLIEIVGLALVTAGYGAWQQQWRIGGLLAATAGVLLIGAAIAVAVSAPEVIVHRLELLPGLLGLIALLAGLLPVRSGWERSFVAVGTALLFIGVATSGVVRGSTLVTLLVAGIATVVAWDLGDQAISLGHQLGRGARTYRTELAHLGGTVLAGGGTLVATLGVRRLDVQGLSLTSLVVLLVAGFLLAVSLRQ